MNRFVLILLGCAGIAALTYLRGGATAAPPDAAHLAMPPGPSWVLSPKASIQGVGYAEPASQVRRLVFRGLGVIEHCLVKVGAVVKTGDVLMTLYNSELKTAIELVERDLEVARSQRAKVLSGIDPYQIAVAEQKKVEAAEQLRYATQEFRRLQALRQTDSVTEREADAAESSMIRARVAMKAAEAELLHLRNFVRPDDRELSDATVKLAEARLAHARAELENTFLRAPCDGTVLEILHYEGEGARAMDLEPAIILGDLSRIQIRAEIDERYITRLRPGQNAVVFGRGLGTQRYQGKVAGIRSVMGKKTVFARTATERKDLDVVQVIIRMEAGFKVPIGLEVDVQVEADIPGQDPAE